MDLAQSGGDIVVGSADIAINGANVGNVMRVVGGVAGGTGELVGSLRGSRAAKNADVVDDVADARRVANMPSEPSVHRVVEPGKPQFQLNKGEEGLSVFDAQKVDPSEVLAPGNFRPGSEIRTKTVAEVENLGLTLKKTPGNPNHPKILQENHWEIRPGTDMTRKQFKKRIKELE